MQPPTKESPPAAVPHNGSTPLPTKGSKSDRYLSRHNVTRWRKSEQISLLVKFGHIGRRRLMELAHLAGELDPRIVPVIEDWDRMKSALQNAANLDALCDAHGVDPTHFISVVGEAEMRFRDSASVILAALSLPSVVQKSIEMALTGEGAKDREMLFQHSGFLPQHKASQIRALNYAVIRTEADVNTDTGEPLPTFEETIADSDELIGDEE